MRAAKGGILNAALPGEQITGDNVLIARETARALGLGTRIRTPEGLPSLPASGRVPRDLGTTLAPAVLASDGFAQARRLPPRTQLRRLQCHTQAISEARPKVWF